MFFQATVHTETERVVEQGDAPKHSASQAKADVALKCINRLGYVVASDGASVQPQQKRSINTIKNISQQQVKQVMIFLDSLEHHPSVIASRERGQHAFVSTLGTCLVLSCLASSLCTASPRC